MKVQIILMRDLIRLSVADSLGHASTNAIRTKFATEITKTYTILLRNIRVERSGYISSKRQYGLFKSWGNPGYILHAIHILQRKIVHQNELR